MNKKNKKGIISFLMSFFIVISVISVGDISVKAANDEYLVAVNTTQYYAIANLGSRLQLNVVNNGTKNGTNVNISKWTGGSGQTFKFTKTSQGYMITPKCNANSRINVYGNSAKEGSNICLWSNTNHSTQAFIVEYNKSKDAFILRSVSNRNYVLTAESTKAGANVKLSKYNANNKNQYWFAKSLTAKKKTTQSSNPVASTLKITGQNLIKTINNSTGTVDVGLKSYKYKGVQYSILSNATTFTGSTYNQFNANYKSTFGNDGCGATACACSIAIMTNSNKNPQNYWTKNSGCILSNYGEVGTTKGENAVLKKSVELINSKKPGVLQMSKDGNLHFVTVIGYKTGANTNALTRDDILVIDPATGSIKTLTEAMSYNYDKKNVDSVRWFKSLK